MANVLPEARLLRIFACVVRHQGFAPAQQELNLSTSAISTYMSQLEALVGVVLCHRGRGGFALTPKGEEFHQEALRVLAELDGFERYAAGMRGDLRGSLKVGVLDATISDPMLPLPAIVGEFAREHPAVQLHLNVQSPYDLQLSVLGNRLDVAIGAFQLRMNGLVYQPLYREQHWLYCSDAHPLFGDTRIAPEAIGQQRMVSRSYWSQTELARHGFKRSEAAVDSMEGQLILILSGAYIGFLPEHFAKTWVDAGRLRALLPASFGYQAPFSVVLRRGRAKEPLVQKFRDALKRHVASADTDAFMHD
ncbi:LysR family transcriptional regulator [Paraburkholderia caballeronis]|uniref:DNA-binding transcriptional regulator, LysR family n=1 Tax=Paraburkholderia caballeronis TaxID=416943 RepID=A0A1H7NYL6_9BURK|nr:LysR family transcriptional regulator [Paraburkholderia caballeronis]PXW25467.1 transcriptional regulator [Paraburkholderia caballeronis]PXX01074.1 transcriptional regulator [Paraburkholderia caballeronis]RAJ99573.1 transcriptional regulator [Paraburkholderia caballeronis]TDV11448.1 transcriptional regulator [Paraburkholderia caballeronis]TDV14638.1 transcriptional regulator [Paraburkholderia caballeronis]